MVTNLIAKDVDDYDQQLADLITAKILQRKKVTFIDCSNHISQYMFHENDLPYILDNLFIARIERIHELIDQLVELPRERTFQKSSVLIVSPYQSVMEEEIEDEGEQQEISSRIEALLDRLETHHDKEVYLLEVKKEWATPFLPKDMSSMGS